MPAVTVNSVEQWSNGNKVQIVANIDIATNGDTWDTTLNTIYHFGATPTTAVAVGGTKSNGTITFALPGGALTGVLVSVIGDGE